MASVRVIGLLAAHALLAARRLADLQAATEDDPGAAPAKKSADPKDILVPIPSYSKDVERQRLPTCAPGRRKHSPGPISTSAHVPFAELISETIGRYSVRAILDAPGEVHGLAGAARCRLCARWSSSTCCATGSAVTGCTRSSL